MGFTFPQWRSVDFLPLRDHPPRQAAWGPRSAHSSRDKKLSGPPSSLHCGHKRRGLIPVDRHRGRDGAARTQTRNTDKAFSGHIKTVTLNIKAKFAPAVKENDS
jgi:hypothetical protein